MKNLRLARRIKIQIIYHFQLHSTREPKSQPYYENQ